jgi:hypothetical protein
MMDTKRFDVLTKILATSVTRQHLVRLLSGGAAAGVAALSGRERAAAGKAKAKGEGRPKVTLCHKRGRPAEKTLEVPHPAVAAHLRHGDTLGPCPEEGTTPSACAGGPCTGDPGSCAAPCLCGPFGMCVGPNTCPGGLCSGGPGQQGTCESAICDCTAAANGTCEAPAFPGQP